MATRKTASTKKKKALVIVESPAKAKTINRYLGKNYTVESSKGHLIDLPKSRLAVDVDNDFKPEYKIIYGRTKILKDLQKNARKAESVYLATDPDREGEAISWHLANALKESNANIQRITFNEITKTAVQDALKHPSEIDKARVDAQQARRILDRLVGYNLSPLLWKKVKSGLSAGRVQSVALRIICEREEAINAFVPIEYWSLEAQLKVHDHEFRAKLSKIHGEKVDEKRDLPNEAAVLDIINTLNGATYTVTNVVEKERKRSPLSPYITSKLQQDGMNMLGFPARKTMYIAQRLYEGVEVPGEGPVGLITYMRTDSTRVNDSALQELRNYIKEEYGDVYLPEKPRTFKMKKSAQDAHEAIRPTSVLRTPDKIRDSLDKNQYKLYKLIWERFVASQMAEAKYKQTSVEITAHDMIFSVSGSVPQFAGFTKVFDADVKKKSEKKTKIKLPRMDINDTCDLCSLEKEQHFTQPPPRFTDASLVKMLEESGIGRPSTYAPTLTTLVSRYYVQRKKKTLIPTELGGIVKKLLVENFPNLVSVDFTVKMEAQLDEIAAENQDWVSMVRDFYKPFIVSVEKAQKYLEKVDYVSTEETDYVCEKCGKKMLKRMGRYGYFLGCSGFPECRNTKPLPLGECPKCENGQIIAKKTKKGRVFYGCTNYPECDFVTWNEIIKDRHCPRCNSSMAKVIENKIEMEKCLKCDYSAEIEDE